MTDRSRNKNSFLDENRAESTSRRASRTFQLPDAEIVYFAEFFDGDESRDYFEKLAREIEWRHDKIRMFGREILQPRLTAWYGDAGRTYTYSGLTLHPLGWTPDLLAIKTKVENAASAHFNSVLLNLYRDGRDSMGWHADDEPELGENPTIASVSFGDPRRFRFKHKYEKKRSGLDLDLADGSLLVMAGTTQRFWLHGVTKTAKPVGPRINLTFRTVI